MSICLENLEGRFPQFFCEIIWQEIRRNGLHGGRTTKFDAQQLLSNHSFVQATQD